MVDGIGLLLPRSELLNLEGVSTLIGHWFLPAPLSKKTEMYHVIQSNLFDLLQGHQLHLSKRSRELTIQKGHVLTPQNCPGFSGVSICSEFFFSAMMGPNLDEFFIPSPGLPPNPNHRGFLFGARGEKLRSDRPGWMTRVFIMAGQPTPPLTYPPPRNKALLRAY